jgi:hypothetical protein
LTPFSEFEVQASKVEVNCSAAICSERQVREALGVSTDEFAKIEKQSLCGGIVGFLLGVGRSYQIIRSFLVAPGVTARMRVYVYESGAQTYALLQAQNQKCTSKKLSSFVEIRNQTASSQSRGT